MIVTYEIYRMIFTSSPKFDIYYHNILFDINLILFLVIIEIYMT